MNDCITASLYVAIVGSWRIVISSQLTLPDDIPSTRDNHSLTAISLTPGLIEVTMFGGAPSFFPGQRDSEVHTIAATTIIMFGELNECT